MIRTLKDYLPSSVQKVLPRADAEFMCWSSVEAVFDEGFDFIFSNKQCEPPFEPERWYWPRQREEAQFNSCIYKQFGWKQACRFVVMLIPRKPDDNEKQIRHELFEEDRYNYRIICTNLNGTAHEVIDTYDKWADAENLIGESKQEGLDAIPSGKCKNNYAFFQIAMLAYNLWRYFKILANLCGGKVKTFAGIADNKIRIARLKLLIIGVKAVKSGNRDIVKYSIHYTRTAALPKLYEFLDRRRFEKLHECKI